VVDRYGRREEACVIEEAGEGGGHRIHTGSLTGRCGSLRSVRLRPVAARRYDHAMRTTVLLLAACMAASTADAQTRPARRPAPKPAAAFKTTLTLEQMAGKQAVIATSRGTFVIQLLPEVAPNHVGYFITQAREGAYDKTTFHRAIRLGIIQGGDPLSKDPGKRAQYGTGGLGVLAAEFNREPVTRGAVAAVLQPGRPDSGGAQFFVAVTDQPALNGQFTVFGRVVEGLEVVQAISEAPVDDQARVVDRLEIASVSIRDAPPPEAVPFSTESVEDLARYRAVLETTEGAITIEFDPVKAPNHVRNFLRLAAAGVYNGTSVHRVVKGFVIQTGLVATRSAPLTQKQQSYVTTLAPEFNDTPHVAGTVSMARTEDPDSASTSFFICTGPAPSLNGQYSAFGRVVSGMPVVMTIEGRPVDGEAPVERIDLIRVRVMGPN
jgi:cyclophilin family peptidyl-prolyl cis-trans isomerase